MKPIRHGDLALFPVDKLPEGLKEAKTKIIMTGSGGNNHSFDNGVFHPVINSGFVVGYLVAEKTTLYHMEHGKKVSGEKLREANIPDRIYRCEKQREDTHDRMKPVED